MSGKLSRLLYHAHHGQPIFPCHWVREDGRCSCGDAGCKSPGKHLLVNSGFYAASTDQDQIKAWHEKWQLANWALRTGTIIVVDIDPRNGGDITWDTLRTDHLEPIETIKVRTGGGGTHYWFALPDGMVIDSKEDVWPGIDVKAAKGYVMIPPSKTTAEYRFEIGPNDVKELPDPPEWMLDRLNHRPKTTFQSTTAVAVPQGARHQALIEKAAKMKAAGMAQDEIGAALLAARDNHMESGDHPVTDAEVAQVIAWVNNKNRSYAPTDLGNAERFIDLHSDKLRFCYAWDKWIYWDGRRWAHDDEAEAIKLAHAAVRAIYAEAAAAIDVEVRKNLARHALVSEARFKIMAMLESAKPYLAISPDKIDQHPDLLNCASGIIDLKTGELLPHDPKLMLSRMVDINFDPHANCPKWESFIELITGGDKDMALFIQCAIGYSLTGRVDEAVLFFVFGFGKNGKTTFFEALRMLFGEFYVRTEVEALLMNFHSGENASPHIASLKGARLAVASELPEGRKLNESLIKNLTGGDVLSARFLFSNPFTFTPTHKLWMVGNYKPKIRGTDEGIWRRIKIIPFRTTIDKPRPMSEVLAEFRDELPGILGWAVCGSIFWYNSGLEIPSAVQQATAEYKNESDLVSQFIDDICTLKPGVMEQKTDLFQAWQKWCAAEGEEDAARRGKRWLTTQFLARGLESGGHGNDSILGVILNGA